MWAPRSDALRRRTVASCVPLDSLAARTESWFLDEVLDFGDAFALRCASDPLFRWGNLLFLKSPPAPGSRRAWEARFRSAFADMPEARHVTFAWRGVDGALGEFTSVGYEPDVNTVREARAGDLAAQVRRPDRFELREVRSERDWQAVFEMLLEDDPDGEDPAAFLRHRRDRMAIHRAIADGRRPGLRGGWYLATVAGEPAGSMGIFVREGLGRFQYVQVAGAHRRKGVATAMVHAVANEGIRRWGAERLVIIADEGTPADAIYARLGFQALPNERYVGATRRQGPAGDDLPDRRSGP